MTSNEDNIKKALAKIQPNLFDILGKLQEIELNDVTLDVMSWSWYYLNSLHPPARSQKRFWPRSPPSSSVKASPSPL